MLLLRFLGRERLTPLIILVLLFHRAAVEAAPVRAADPVVEADQAADMGQAQAAGVVAVVQGPVRPEIVMKVVDRPARAVMTASHQAVVTSPP